MPAESADFISQLDQDAPDGGQPVSEGDDHLRVTKHVLQTQFPGVGGLGFAKAILATEDELNYLTGVTSNIQSQLDAITASVPAATGTALVFYQSTAPLGWTQNKTLSNLDGATMRITTANGGGIIYGTDDISNPPSTNHTHTVAGETGNTQLTINQIPQHTHDTSLVWTNKIGGSSIEPLGTGVNLKSETVTSSQVGGGQTHKHAAGNLTATSSGPTQFKPKHINSILCIKD